MCCPVPENAIKRININIKAIAVICKITYLGADPGFFRRGGGGGGGCVRRVEGGVAWLVPWDCRINRARSLKC